MGSSNKKIKRTKNAKRAASMKEQINTKNKAASGFIPKGRRLGFRL